jgi:hypothetical protein
MRTVAKGPFVEGFEDQFEGALDDFIFRGGPA